MMNEFKDIMNKEDYMNLLCDIIKNKMVFDFLSTDGHGNKLKYVIDEKMMDSISGIGKISTCYDFNIVEDIVYKTMNQNIETIAEWLVSDRAALKIKTEYENNIGYVLNDDGRTDTNIANVVLRKEINDKTEYGFFISTVKPSLS